MSVKIASQLSLQDEASQVLQVRTKACCTGFEGDPIMLEDGMIYDSARLPSNAVQEYPITVSAASLAETLASQPAAIRGHPITFSGGSLMESHNEDYPARLTADGRPVTYSGNSALDSGPGVGYNQRRPLDDSDIAEMDRSRPLIDSGVSVVEPATLNRQILPPLQAGSVPFSELVAVRSEPAHAQGHAQRSTQGGLIGEDARLTQSGAPQHLPRPPRAVQSLPRFVSDEHNTSQSAGSVIESHGSEYGPPSSLSGVRTAGSAMSRQHLQGDTALLTHYWSQILPFGS